MNKAYGVHAMQLYPNKEYRIRIHNWWINVNIWTRIPFIQNQRVRGQNLGAASGDNDIEVANSLW